MLENNVETTQNCLNQIQALTTEIETKSNELNDLKEAQKTQNELNEKETKDLKSKLKTLDMYAKLFLPETCSELKKTGLNEPVTTLINPAGSDREFAPIQVQCDLTENKTILGTV
jgi:septal ring factor EnvC (AmiA/AmiB activator)